MTEKVIPEHFIPPVASEVVERDGENYWQANESMFTFYKRTKGEFSRYFLALRDDFKILGIKCPKCGVVRIPPFALMCPDCDFEEMEYLEMPDRGVMNSTPPITYFAHSLFQSWVPFGRGRVILDGADTALPVHVHTTKGVLTPFIFEKGTPVKIVFRDERLGKPTDIFAVPMAELTPAQQSKTPLMESDLDFSAAAEPAVGEASEAQRVAFVKAVEMLSELAANVGQSPRAQSNLAGWQRTIEVKTAAGSLTLRIDDGSLAVTDNAPEESDFLMVLDDPGLLVEWLTFKEALTNAIVTGALWISVNKEFTTIFKLDRLPRSVRRDLT